MGDEFRIGELAALLDGAGALLLDRSRLLRVFAPPDDHRFDPVIPMGMPIISMG
jgi:hypothetical protein